MQGKTIESKYLLRERGRQGKAGRNMEHKHWLMSGRQSDSAGGGSVSRSRQKVLINKVLEMSGAGWGLRGAFSQSFPLPHYLLSSHLSDQAAAGLSEYEVLTSW